MPLLKSEISGSRENLKSADENHLGLNASQNKTAEDGGNDLKIGNIQ